MLFLGPSNKSVHLSPGPEHDPVHSGAGPANPEGPAIRGEDGGPAAWAGDQVQAGGGESQAEHRQAIQGTERQLLGHLIPSSPPLPFSVCVCVFAFFLVHHKAALPILCWNYGRCVCVNHITSYIMHAEHNTDAYSAGNLIPTWKAWLKLHNLCIWQRTCCSTFHL